MNTFQCAKCQRQINGERPALIFSTPLTPDIVPLACSRVEICGGCWRRLIRWLHEPPLPLPEELATAQAATEQRLRELEAQGV